MDQTDGPGEEVKRSKPTLYASDAMIEHIRVLEEAFGPNLPQILRQFQGGVHIVRCRVVDEVPDH